MRLSLGVLNSVGQILFSFNGATIVTLGDITLPARADPVTQQVLFTVVGDLGPYNAIIGWAWLHSMKVVPSTYHKMVRLTFWAVSWPQGSDISYLCRNKTGRRASKVLRSRIKPPRSNHSLPLRSGRRKRIR